MIGLTLPVRFTRALICCCISCHGLVARIMMPRSFRIPSQRYTFMSANSSLTPRYPYPPDSYSQKLLQQITDNDIIRADSNCFRLVSVEAKTQGDFIDVLIQFDVLPRSVVPRKPIEPWIYCTAPAREHKSDGLESSNENKGPSTAVIICCCVMVTLLLLVFFLRCRSCLRRRYQQNQHKMAQKFWYCAECSASVTTDRWNLRATSTQKPPSGTQSSIFSSWSEVLPPNGGVKRGLLGNQYLGQYRSCISPPSSANVSGSPGTPGNRDPTEPSALASGYMEYYKRQGRLPTDIELNLNRQKIQARRNPPLWQIYQGGDAARNVTTNGKTETSVLPVLKSGRVQGDSRSDVFKSAPTISSEADSIACTGNPMLSLNESQEMTDSCVQSKIKIGIIGSDKVKSLSSGGSCHNLNSVWELVSSNSVNVCATRPTLPEAGAQSTSDVKSQVIFSQRLSVPIVNDASSATECHGTSDQPSSNPLSEVKTARSPLCLFTARRKPRRRLYHASKGYAVYAYPQNRRRSSAREVTYMSKTGPDTPLSAISLTPDRAFGNETSHLQHLNLQLHTIEARSCSNLKDNDGPRSGICSYLDTESTSSPLNPAIDLPDVYLNPPSLSSLQSPPGSMVLTNSLQRNHLSEMPQSRSYTRSFTSVCEAQALRTTMLHPIFSLGPDERTSTPHHNNTWTSRGNVNIDSPHATADPGAAVHHRYATGNDTLPVENGIHYASKPTECPAGHPISKEKIPFKGLGPLKRALSLTLRPKEPKSLGAELQSIMDKHYEMTGIRMITAGPTHVGLSQRNESPGTFNGCRDRRRSSWSFGKDDVIFRIPASMKSALSALHLDCLQPDHIQARKNTQSVLSTLTAAALPCMAPLRSRLHSDTCSIKVDGADERQQTSTLQRSSTFLASPARSLSAPRDFDSHLLGVHGPIRAVRSSASLFPLG